MLLLRATTTTETVAATATATTTATSTAAAAATATVASCSANATSRANDSTTTSTGTTRHDYHHCSQQYFLLTVVPVIHGAILVVALPVITMNIIKLITHQQSNFHE